MIRQRTGGSIIQVSSIDATAGIEKLAAYSTAKATGPCQDYVAEEAVDGARNVP